MKKSATRTFPFRVAYLVGFGERKDRVALFLNTGLSSCVIEYSVPIAVFLAGFWTPSSIARP